MVAFKNGDVHCVLGTHLDAARLISSLHLTTTTYLPERLTKGCSLSGYPRFGVRVEGSAAAAPETHGASACSSCNPHPVSVEMLRCRRKLRLNRYLENTSSAPEVTAIVSQYLSTHSLIQVGVCSSIPRKTLMFWELQLHAICVCHHTLYPTPCVSFWSQSTILLDDTDDSPQTRPNATTILKQKYVTGNRTSRVIFTIVIVLSLVPRQQTPIGVCRYLVFGRGLKVIA